MSFRCDKCKKISKSYEKQFTKIIEKREKIYHYFVIKVRKGKGKNEQIITQIAPDIKNPNIQLIKEFNTKGWEIKKEIKLCKECVK